MTQVDPATVADLFADAESTQQHYLLNPPLAVLDALATVGTEETDAGLPPLRILTHNNTLYEIRQQFPLASRLQQLIDSDRIALRKSGDSQNTVLVSESDLTAFVLIEETVAWLSPAETPDTTHLFGEIEELWETAETYPLRTPPLPATLELAGERLGESFRQQFAEAVAWAGDLENPTAFHATRAAVVLGAVGEHLHYDVSKWGEDAGVASKASFSRHKSDLEERGIVRTEKVQVPMGRPRQRLFLTEEYRERFEEEGLDALLAVATTTEVIDGE